MDKPLVFISYSHKDKVWEEKFRPHLTMLEKIGSIVVWDDRKINPGQEWYDEIKLEMSKAAVSVCLISADYLASDFVVKEEVPYLLTRREKEGMVIIPVLIKDCLWEEVRWLEKLQMLPEERKSIAEDHPNSFNREFKNIVKSIIKIIKTPDFTPPKPTILWEMPEKIDVGRLPETGAKLFGREKELKWLGEAWESEKTNIISIIAWGGEGKSTLVNKWLENMGEDNYKEAKRVFAWSFYSQGTNEQVTSADQFISEGLKWFDDPDPTSGSAWDKGQRLAELIRKKETLLILDGMEPLQSSNESERGKIKDQGLGALLRSLARNNNGLCIVTSRENVEEISKYEPRVQQINLEKLSAKAGRALFRVGGVQGTDQELEAGVETFGNHSLAIKLISVYLQNFKGHHISNANQIPDFKISEEKGKHARRVVEALHKRHLDNREGELLQLLGFFDRPADIAAIKKIIEPPVIENLTGNLCNRGEASLLQAINTLRNKSLLTEVSKHRPDVLDCHPLIREHFGEKLQKQNLDAWKQVHQRLYEFYKDLPEKEFPETLEKMVPLFAAIKHGCLAEKHKEVLFNVYWKKIKRGNEHYITRKLGSFGSNLTCISHLLGPIREKTSFGLIEKYRTVLMVDKGSGFCATGRPAEAVEPFKAGLKFFVKQRDWLKSAVTASSLSEVYLFLGDLMSAQNEASLCMVFASRSPDRTWKVYSRCSKAYVLLQAGKLKEANKMFLEAETIQKQNQPQSPYLYSIYGFYYCDLLLSRGHIEEVLIRGKTTVKYNKEGWYSLLDIALDNLTIGKALALRCIDHHSSNSLAARDFLNQAVDGLREAGRQEDLPRGLLARANLFGYQKDFRKSWNDLDEAWEIAKYGQMKLHLTDYYLEAAKVIKAQLENGRTQKEFTIIEDGLEKKFSKPDMNSLFKEHVEKAHKLIQETGYHRRDKELEELKKHDI